MTVKYGSWLFIYKLFKKKKTWTKTATKNNNKATTKTTKTKQKQKTITTEKNLQNISSETSEIAGTRISGPGAIKLRQTHFWLSFTFTKGIHMCTLYNGAFDTVNESPWFMAL